MQRAMLVVRTIQSRDEANRKNVHHIKPKTPGKDNFNNKGNMGKWVQFGEKVNWQRVKP